MWKKPSQRIVFKNIINSQERNQRNRCNVRKIFYLNKLSNKWKNTWERNPVNVSNMGKALSLFTKIELKGEKPHRRMKCGKVFVHVPDFRTHGSPH